MPSIEMTEKSDPDKAESDQETTFGNAEEKKEVAMVPYSTLFRLVYGQKKLSLKYLLDMHRLAINYGSSVPLLLHLVLGHQCH